MHTLVLEVRPDIVAALRLPVEEQTDRLRQELAIRLYQKHILSFGKARQLANLSKWDFTLLLGREGIARHYDQEDLADDLKTLETLP